MSAEAAAEAYESLLTESDSARRKGQGVYYTPSALVDHVLDLALQPALDRHRAEGGALEEFKVLDLAVGVSRFLLPAARRIADAYGVDVQTAAAAVFGVDVDPIAIEVGRRLLGPEARLLEADGLVDDVSAAFAEVFDRANPGFDVVLGNPPFLNRVELATKGAAVRTAVLKRRYAEVWATYVNAATLFLVESTRLAREGATIALVQPESLMGARDSAAAREWLDARTALTSLWVSKDQVFGAAVRTVVPVLVKGATGASVARTVGLPPRQLPPLTRERGSGWGALAADVYGIPRIPPMATAGVFGDLAAVSAGFLQEYYLLAPHVREGGSGQRVATSGMVGGFAVDWGSREVRLHKRRMLRPTVDLSDLDDETRKRWTFRTGGQPKLLIATQTKVLQVGLDAGGECVASVPLITAVPQPGVPLPLLAAIFAAPVLSALAAEWSIGVGLAGGVIKLSAEQTRSLPLPALRDEWESATARFDQWFHSGREPYELIEVARQMNRAYGVPDDTALGWWLERRRQR